jgi:hypothetical protein
LTVFGQDQFGGAEVPDDPSSYLELETGSGAEISAVLDFTATGGPGPVGYFGFWWSAGDGNNRLEVTRADGSVETFTTQSIINSPALQGSPDGNGVGVVDGHFGNPTTNSPPGVNGQNSGEAYAFVNIYALDEASKITSVRFITSGSGFESDNHTICTELIDTQTGTDVGGITIRKETNSSSDTTTEFEFSQTIEADNGGSFPNFTLTKDGEQTFSNVTPGAYTVTEVSIPSPYTLDVITCIDPDGDNSSGDVGTATATIDLAPNEAVICTFTNNDPTLAITLGWFLAEADGETVDFRWQTVTETGTAGFNVLAATDEGKVQLNAELIPSPVVDSVTPTNYAVSLATDATTFYLQEVGVDGGVTEHGPFALGEAYGEYSVPGGVELSPRIWLPLMVR